MELKEFCLVLKALAARAMLFALVILVASEVSFATSLAIGWADLRHPGLRSFVIDFISMILSTLPGGGLPSLLRVVSAVVWFLFCVILMHLLRMTAKEVMNNLEWKTMEYYSELSAPRKLIRALDGYSYDIEEVHERFFGRITKAKQAIAERKAAAQAELEKTRAEQIHLCVKNEASTQSVATTTETGLQVVDDRDLAFRRAVTEYVEGNANFMIEHALEVAEMVGDEGLGEPIEPQFVERMVRDNVNEFMHNYYDFWQEAQDIADGHNWDNLEPLLNEDFDHVHIEAEAQANHIETQTDEFNVVNQQHGMTQTDVFTERSMACKALTDGDCLIDIGLGIDHGPALIGEANEADWEFEHPRVSNRIKAREHLALAICAELKTRKAPVVYRAQTGLDMILSAECNIMYKELRRKKWFTDVRRHDWAEATNLAIALYKIPTISECAVKAIDDDENVKKRKKYFVDSAYFWIEDFVCALFFMERKQPRDNNPIQL
jgi:hypothetical protein